VEKRKISCPSPGPTLAIQLVVRHYEYTQFALLAQYMMQHKTDMEFIAIPIRAIK
jgi:hypothetical protein